MAALPTVRVLGPLEAELGGSQTPIAGFRQRALLARLVIAEGQPVAASVIAEDVWGDPSATDSVKMAVSRLRRVLGSDVVRHDGRGYLLEPSAFSTDAQEFEARLAAARRVTGEEARRGYEAALGLWRDRAYSDVVDAPFCLAEAARLDEQRLIALSEYLEARLDAGEALELVPELEMLVAEHPWREVFTEQLMVALYRGGRQRDALDTYRRLETTLRDELGIAPNPRARALQLAILQQADSLQPSLTPPGTGLSAGVAAVAAEPQPLPGRACEVARLRELWKEACQAKTARVAVITGPAGIGKTTLLEHLAQALTADGRTLLTATCEPHARIPFQAI